MAAIAMVFSHSRKSIRIITRSRLRIGKHFSLKIAARTVTPILAMTNVRSAMIAVVAVIKSARSGPSTRKALPSYRLKHPKSFQFRSMTRKMASARELKRPKVPILTKLQRPKRDRLAMTMIIPKLIQLRHCRITVQLTRQMMTMIMKIARRSMSHKKSGPMKIM